MTLEDTGGDGLHLWVFFEPRVAASSARTLLREVLWRAGPASSEVSVEIFPKQDHLSGKGLGNLIKVPLGLHQATLRRSTFLDGDLRPLADDVALGGLVAAGPGAVETILRRKVIALIPPSPDQPAAGKPPLLPLSDVRALAVALAEIAPGASTKNAIDKVVEHCSVVRELLRRAMEEHSLPPAGARSLLYTLGLIGRQNDALDTAFAAAGISRKEVERVRCGFQSPAGCRSLGLRFEHWCDACPGPAVPAGLYATPVLFADYPALTRAPAVARLAADFQSEPPANQPVLLGIQEALERIGNALEHIGNHTNDT